MNQSGSYPIHYNWRIIISTDLIRRGGSPIGLLRFEKENAQVQGSFRPFEEYKNEESVKKYLAGLLDNTGEIVSLSQQQQSFPAAY